MKRLLQLGMLLLAFCMTSCDFGTTETQNEQPEPKIEYCVMMTQMFDEPQVIQCESSYVIHETIFSNFGITSDYSDENAVCIITGDTCFNGLNVCANENERFMLVGTCNYMLNDSTVRKIPILQLFETDID